MCRVYGKWSSPLVSQFTKPDDSKVELSDEDDVEQGTDQGNSTAEPTLSTSDGEIEQALSKETTEDISKLHCDSEDITCNSSIPSSVHGPSREEVAKLKAFDFLDSDLKPKKRKTNYTRNSCQTDDSSVAGLPDVLIDRTVSDLNDFLSSLNSSTEEADLQGTLEKELRSSIKERKSDVKGRVMYDRSRTMLYKKDGEEDLVEDVEGKEGAAIETPAEHQMSAEGTTHHYNELKNMGEWMKYQDDLEFLTEKSPANFDSNLFTSRLINLTLTLSQDEDFLAYIHRHCTVEVCGWFLAKKSLDHPVIMLLQAFLLVKIQLPEEHLPPYFEQLVLALLSMEKLPHSSALHSKMARLNFTDFVKKTDRTTGQSYALQLCLKYRDILHSNEVGTRLLHLIEKNDDPRIRPLLHPLADYILTTNSVILNNTIQANSLLRSLIAALPQERYDEHLIKSLILLSNEPQIIANATAQEKRKIMDCSLDFVLEYIHFVKSKMMDLVLLHLGLILNLIDVCDWKIQDAQLKLARDLLPKQTDTDGTEFVTFMFYLALTHLLHLSGAILRRDEKMTLMKLLKEFDNGVDNCNPTIHERVNTALQYLL